MDAFAPSFSPRASRRQRRPRRHAAHLAKDPVCGMTVDPATAKHRAEHAGHTYYFCCAGCRAKFEADPAKYLAAARQLPRSARRIRCAA